MNKKRCAYCGVPVSGHERDHVFPSNLYPSSRKDSKVQRMTVPVCSRCNSSFSNDEVHFRNILFVAGEPNEAIRELWQTKANPSFKEKDGKSRIRDILEQMKQVKTEADERWSVYPGRDERVMRIVRKVIRGLCDYHKIMSPVSDQRVWASVLMFEVPPGFLEEMEYCHREKDIAEYRYQILDEPPIHSVWLITFFEQRKFIGIVSSSEDGFPEEWLA